MRKKKMLWLHVLDLGMSLAFAAQVIVCWSAPREDALICFRYARNWVRGLGMVYNPGEYVEGYSNSIWTLALGALHWTGLTLFAADNLLVLLCAVAAILVLCRAGVKAFGDTWVARLPALLMLCHTSVPGGYGNGLEGSGVSLGVSLMILGLVRGASPALGLGGALLVLLRPEGFIYAGVIGLYCLAGFGWDREKRGRYAAVLVTLAATIVCLTAFRLWYYDDFIPNTVRAKENLRSFAQFRAGLSYLGRYFDPATTLLAALALLSLFARKFRKMAAVLLLCVAANAVVVLENGGDWMPHLRLLTPFFGVLAFLGAAVVSQAHRRSRAKALLLTMVLLAVSVVHFQPVLLCAYAKELPFEIRRMFDAEAAGYSAFGATCTTLEDYQEPDELLVSEWGGMPPFVLDGLRTIELLGLTDRELAAYRGPDVDYVSTGGRIVWPLILRRHPTLMLLFTPYLEKRLKGIEKADPASLDNFLLVQQTPLEDEMMALFIRDDRPLLGKSLLCAGMITPARDLLEASLAQGEQQPWASPEGASRKVSSQWADEAWRGPDGTNLLPAWRAWNDQMRFSVRLPLAPGTMMYSREALDDSPILFLVGRHVFLAPNVTLSIYATNSTGERRSLETRTLLGTPEDAFVIDALKIERGRLQKGDIIELSLDSPGAGGVLLGAYRWTKTELPEIPASWRPSTERFAVASTLPADEDLDRLRDRLEEEPQDAEANGLLGRALLRAGRLDDARDCLLRAVAFDRCLWPAGAAPLQEIAERYAAAGRSGDAITLLARAARLDPGNPGPHLKVGAALEQSNNPGDALAVYRDALAEGLASAELTFRMDKLLQTPNCAQNRVAAWRDITVRHPQNPAAAFYLGKALEASGDAAAAEAAYRQSLEIDPRSGEPNLALAGLMARRGECGQAMALCSEAVAADRSVAGIAVRNLADAAQYREAAGDLAGALCLLRGACALNPPDPGDLLLLGTALERAGDAVAALEVYRRTADANPEQADTAARMDAILLARGDPQARVAEWRAMSERHPKSRMPRLQLAAAMTDAGETGPAADAFQTLLAEAPGDVEAQLGLADALARGGDGLTALEGVRALAPVTPEQTAAAAAALDRIAELLVARSETKAAAEVLRKSVALEPDNFQHTMLLAGVLEQLGDGDGALGLYRTIVTALPDSPKSSDRIDAIYAARGDAAGRAAEWRALAEKHPEAALPRERLADALARAGDPDGARAAREQADKNAGAAGS
jgi:tetratricopeptide (TPR) repeat protein